MIDPESDIPNRIEDAMREYADPDSQMTVEELEAEIEKAFRMEYNAHELLSDADVLIPPATQSGTIQIFGIEADRDGTVQLDEVFDQPDPFDIVVDPWDDDEYGIPDDVPQYEGEKVFR